MYQPCGPSDFSKVQGCKPDRGVGGWGGRKRKETVSSVPTSKQNQPTIASYFIIIVSITRFSFLLKIKGLIQPWMC